MIEWVMLRGEGPAIGKWLAWAKKQARFMYENDIRPTKRIQAPDGTLVSIEIRDDEAFIRVVGGMAGSYQFIGSLDYLYKTFDDDNLPAGTRYLPLVYAVHAQVKGGNWTATPLVSSAEAPSSGFSWPYDPDPRNTDDYLILKPAHQWDGCGIRQWYGPTAEIPKKNVPWLLTQWQQNFPCHGLYRYSGLGTWGSLDTGYDLGPNFFSGDGLIGINKTPDSDWYGQAAIRVVSNRNFIIMADVNSVFYCYPTDGYGPEFIDGGTEWPGEKANVPLNLTKSQACPWPAWVTVENLGVAAIEEPITGDEQYSRLRPLWVFDHAGTRAVCITAHRDPAWGDAYFTSSRYSPDGTTLTYEVQYDYPGLVEVLFSIAVTGPNLEDFTFSVSLKQDIYSKEDLRCPIAAGYALRPMGDVTLDELLVLEYEYYTDLPAMAVVADFPHDPGPPTLYQPRRPNMATVASVKRENGGTWAEVKRWLAYYACYPIEVYGDPEPRRFSPLIEDFDEVPNEPDYYWNHFSYTGQIVSMDISSLSFCVTAVVWTMGKVPRNGSDNYGAEAQTIVTTAFGVERDRKSVGHPRMKVASSAMYDLTHPYPDLASMTRFYTNATADYEYYNTGFAEDNIFEYATLTVRLGDSSDPLVNVIQDASEDLRYFVSIRDCPLLAENEEVHSPVIFSYFDDWAYIRPGIRWYAPALQDGTLSFTNYPYGAVYNSNMYALTVSPACNSYYRFGVHRSGSWSIFAGPFAANTSLMLVSEDIANSYEQVIVDVVTLKDITESKDRTTTHIALLNQAFGKTITPEDYFFNIRKLGPLPEFKPNSDDPTAHSWWYVESLSPLGVVLMTQYLVGSRLELETCFDNNFIGTKRYFSYDMRLTFPSPRMECAFLPPK